MQTQEDLALSFWDFPLFLTLALWLCILPVVIALVGWIWGFWQALIASLMLLMVMIAVCLALCLRWKLVTENTPDLSAQAVIRNVRREGHGMANR